MSKELDVLKLVCYRLEQANLLYMVTGSFAANFYALPRMTRDLDIVIEIQKSDVKTIRQIFQEDFYLDEDEISEAVRYQKMFNIIHNESVFKVDFIIRKDSEYRNTEFQRRRKVLFANAEIWIVSQEDLIISKLAWARDSFSEMQIRDIRNLLHTGKPVDNDYLLQWVKTLHLDSIYQKAVTHE